MTNVSFKVKRKPSLVADKRISLFLQIICNREVKQVGLNFKISEEEWSAGTETVTIPPGSKNRHISNL